MTVLMLLALGWGFDGLVRNRQPRRLRVLTQTSSLDPLPRGSVSLRRLRESTRSLPAGSTSVLLACLVAITAVWLGLHWGTCVVAVGASLVVRRELVRRRSLVRVRRLARAELATFDGLTQGLHAGLSPRAAWAEAVHPSMPSADPLATFAEMATFAETVEAWRSDRSGVGRDGAAMILLAHRLGILRPAFVASVSNLLTSAEARADEARAQSSQAEASAVVMTVAPIVFFAVLVLSDPRARLFMLHTSIGSVLLGAGFALDAAAFSWMTRLAQRIGGTS